MDTLISKRLAGPLAVVWAAALLTSCTAADGGTARPASSRTALANSDADFGATFLAGTAKENNAPPNTGDLAPAREQRDPVARRWVQLSADRTDPTGGPLHNGAGRTLYFFTDDAPFAGTSACEENCSRQWPPVVVARDGTVFIDGVSESDVGHLVRTDGLVQLTIAGRPVYRYAGDDGPGQARGQGVDGRWFAVTPSGQRANVTTDGGAA